MTNKIQVTNQIDHSQPKNADWRPLRIAVIGGRGVPSSYSGVESIWDDLFGWFAARGHKVTVYCRPQVLAEKTGSYKGMRLVRTPAPGGKNGETLSHSFFSIMHAILKGDEDGNAFDIISLHTIAPNLFAPIAAMTGSKIISHVHGLDHKREKWKGLGSKVIHLSEKLMTRAADQVVVVNPALVQHYQEEYNLSTSLLPNGIHTINDEFAPDQNVLNQFGLEAGKYIVSVGRLVPEKRIGDTIKAFAPIDTDLKLVFVGEGKYSPEYEKEVKALGARDPRNRVVFTGQQSGHALQTLFRCAGLYCSASELEGMPSSVLECMERKVTPILSDIPPHRALFEGVQGYDLTFAPGDVETLSRKLNWCIRHPEESRVIGEKAREFVRREYAWPVLAERTERLYLKVAGATLEDEAFAGA